MPPNKETIRLDAEFTDIGTFVDRQQLQAAGAHVTVASFRIEGEQVWLTKKVVLRLANGSSNQLLEQVLTQLTGYNLTQGSSNITVSVVDDGLDDNHPNLAQILYKPPKSFL